VDSAEKVQKTVMNDFGLDFKSTSSKQMYSKLSQNQKTTFNKMRYVEHNALQRRREALESNQLKVAKSTRDQLLMNMKADEDNEVDTELNGRLLKVLSMITPNFVQLPRGAKQQSSKATIRELTDKIGRTQRQGEMALRQQEINH
jgi:hypothetical protein